MSLPSLDSTTQDVASHSSRSPSFRFNNSYAQLPERLFARVNPIPVLAPRMVKLNAGLAAYLGLDADALSGPEGVAIFSGNRMAEGSEPLAMAYAGHQFGHFVPTLGDGRANLLGEVIARDGRRYDLQLKGSGPTPFSRRGDGRAALGPVLREYIVSEAMAALGVPTTRALAAVMSGQPVSRETVQPGAIFTRVAASHLRIGTFQYAAAKQDIAGLRALAEYAIARHYPDLEGRPSPIRALLEGVVLRQASLVAQWMNLGFIHGVMNTDNTSISGETIDYGPCAFLEAYEPGKVFSSIDQQGRYAYDNQANAMLWNLARLAESLLPLLEVEAGSPEAGLASAKDALDLFEPGFVAARMDGLLRKLGIASEREGDRRLAEDLLHFMHTGHADFTLTFRRLCDAVESSAGNDPVRGLFEDPEAYDAWAVQWRARLELQAEAPHEAARGMRRRNPIYIPRNHQIARLIDAAVRQDDFGPFEALLEATARPYEDQAGFERFAVPALPEECVRQTFCGT